MTSFRRRVLAAAMPCPAPATTALCSASSPPCGRPPRQPQMRRSCLRSMLRTRTLRQCQNPVRSAHCLHDFVTIEHVAAPSPMGPQDRKPGVSEGLVTHMTACREMSTRKDKSTCVGTLCVLLSLQQEQGFQPRIRHSLRQRHGQAVATAQHRQQHLAHRGSTACMSAQRGPCRRNT